MLSIPERVRLVSVELKPTPATAKVLKHSINHLNHRELITLEVTFARSALAEMNTHRAFSRNSASSRAIPISKMVSLVRDEPFIPRRFSLSQKGMSTDRFVDYDVDPGFWEEVATSWWLPARDSALRYALLGSNRFDLHKQDINRLLEPFMMHTAIISATDWDNFFEQRLALNENGNPLAYPAMYDTAVAMKEAIDASEPAHADPYTWHTPLLGFPGDEDLSHADRLAVSVARCARVSYLTHEGVRDVEADLELYRRLLAGKHLSPFEHVAQATPHGTGNFKQWAQLRTRIESKEKKKWLTA